MGNWLESVPRGGRVAVVRLRSLGDCVLTTPALELLHACRPDLRIAVVVEERFRGVFEDHPAVAELLAPQAGALRRFAPRLCLNLHGGGRSAWLTALSGARWRAGFAHFRPRIIYNVRIPRAQQILGQERTVHTAEHLASAMFFLGVPRCEIPRARLAADRPPAAGPYAVIHPVATRADKMWPAPCFLEVAAHLRASRLEPVFVGGADDDLHAFGAYRVVAGAPLSTLKTLLAGATLFVGNDSGPAHMAAAFSLPVVVLFGASNPAIWGPWRTASEIVTHAAGIGAIEARRVIEALERLRVHA